MRGARPSWGNAVRQVSMFLYLIGLLGLYANGPGIVALLNRFVGPMPVQGQSWMWSVENLNSVSIGLLGGVTLTGGMLGWLWRCKGWRLHLPHTQRTALFITLGVLVGLILWYFRAGNSLGDRINYLLMLRNGQWFYMSQPLSTAVFAAAYQVLSRLGWPPEPAIAAVNCFAGGVWVFLTLKLAEEIPSWNGRLLVVCVLLTGGMAIFFGYVEATPLPMTIALLYLYLARQALSGAQTVLPAALALGIAIAMHGQMLYLIPSFAVLCFAAWRAGQGRQIFPALALAVLPGLLTVSYALTHRELILGKAYGDVLGGGDDRMFVPLTEIVSPYEYYTLFSIGHGMELINLILMVAPWVGLLLVFAIPAAWQRRREPWTWAAVSVILSSLLFVWMWNPDPGLAHDWDLFTPPLMLTLVLSALLWPGHIQDHRDLAWLGAAAGFGLVTLPLTVARFSPARDWDPWSTAWLRLDHPTRVRFGEAIELVGYELARDDYRPGDYLVVDLYWRTRQPLPLDYTAGVHLIRMTGDSVTILTQDDHRPIAWPRYSSQWIVGEIVRDPHVLAIPADASPGQYQLSTVLYDLNTLQRLPLPAEGTDFLRLHTIEIKTGD
jgi:hypothetical protein